MSIIITKYFKFIILIFGILILIKKSKECTLSDGNECINDGEENCKFFISQIDCLDCSQALTEGKTYYTESNEVCEGRSGKENEAEKLIDGTNEIVLNCPESYYQLGDICYNSIPSNAIQENQDSDSNIYKCPRNYIIETKDGFNFHNCINANCDKGNMYYDDNGCYSNSCQNGNTKIKIEYTNIGTLFHCTVSCSGEYKFEYNDNGQIYCLKDCPNIAKYYKDESPYTCLVACEKFTQENKCVESCENNIIIADIKHSIFTCTNDCTIDFPYSYQIEGDNNKYCLKSCNDTRNEYFNGAKTYLSDNDKKCLGESNKPDDYYIDERAIKWVQDCKTSLSGPYHDDIYCKSSCEEKYINNDSLECEKPCSNGYYLEEEKNICYKTCPDNLGKGYHFEDNENSIKKCVSINSDDCPFYNNKKICSTNCQYTIDNEGTTITEQLYHNNGDKFCFEKKCSENINHKYNEKDKYICYNSCSEISNIKYEKDYICYTEEEWTSITDSDLTNYIYYVTDKEITKYINKDLYKECLQANLTFLKGNQCVNQCESVNKKILSTQNMLGKCLSDSDDIPQDYIYYNSSSLIYSKTCELYKIVNLNKELIENGENCILECLSPKCESEKDKLCYTECSNYIEKGNKKIYVEKCDKYFYEDIDNNKKCVEKCDNEHYYLETGECIINCPKTDESNNNYFSYEVIDGPKPCLTKCPDDKPYYYNIENNPKICLNECDKLYSSTDKICTEICGTNEKIHPGKICSSNDCPTNAPFINIDNDVIECSISCKNNKYYNPQTYECEDCERYIYNGGCYSSCPNGLYINGNECVSKCPYYFFKNENNEYECTPNNNCNNINNYITSSKECVKKCPKGEIFIGSNNKCLTSCENEENNKYYEKKIFNNEQDPDNSYNNYLCINDCSHSVNGNYKRINGTNECILSCPPELYEYENICYKNCILNKNAPISTEDNSDRRVCSTQCLKNDKQYYLNDKICISNCKDTINTTIDYDGKTCVNKCDLTSDYKFLQKIETNNDDLICKLSCDPNLPTKRFIRSNYICIEKCEIPNNYVIEEDTENEKFNECLSKCPEDKTYYMRKNDYGEYICSTKKCGEESNDEYKYYYMDTNICLKECGQLYSFTYNSKNYCVNSCDFFKDKKLYHDEEITEDNGNIIYNYRCVEKCNENGNERFFSKRNGFCGLSCEESEYYFEDNYICLSECPKNTTNEDKICKKCTDFSPKKFIDENGNCVDDCSESHTGYKYHIKNEDNNNEENTVDDYYLCLNNCGNKKIEDNVCVDFCTGNKPYIYENNCIIVCPFTKRFYLPDDNICLFDCPNNSKYYTITELNTNMYYKCQDICDAYVPNLYSNMNATFCFGDGNCKNDYPYFEKEETTGGNEIKKCYAQCPSNSPYYKEELTQNIECFAQCPDNTVHLPGSYLCIDTSKCTTKKIKYKNRECVDQCSKNDKIFKNEELSYCLDNCTELPIEITNSDSGLLLTYDNQCVTSCDSSNSEAKDGKCECKRLFYIDKSTQYKKCISQSIQECKNYKDYPININNTNECIDYCNGILSSSGNECYPDNYTCLEYYEKLIELTNGDKKCECNNKYYYYFDNNGNKIKKCLKEDEKCPSSFKLLITETNECVKNCEGVYEFQFEKTCVSSCPSSSEPDSEKKCKCKYKYYIDENNNGICLKENDPCPDKYPLIIDSPEQKQCVSSCIGTGYDYYFNKTCKQNCDNGQLEVITKNDPVAQNYAEKKCNCPNIWYYDEITSEENCYSDSEEKDCDSFTNSKYKKMVYNTKQCVSSCPNGYYEFNNYCLEKCEDYTEQNIVTESDKCSCRDYTEYDENNNNGNIKCLTLDYCKENNNNYSIIEESRKCYKKQENKKCPNDYPFFFNGKCYSENHCPDKTKSDSFEQKCICKYKWYQEGEIVTCLSETSNCPSNYPLLVFSTQECKITNDLGLLEFNYTLYSNCPENTEKENDKCICIKNKDWYKEQTLDGKLYYFCALNECPDDKPYKVEGNDNKECLSTCGEKKKYRGICYDKCPDLTEVGNNNECILSPVNNDLTFDNLEQTITEKLLDLYKSSDASNIINSNSSQKIVTKDATVEFYGVNKNNKGNKHQNIQSDLSYIDISECMEKIYKSNGMKNDDDIIILKFDINTAPDKFLINPVEYKFIDSGTGKELDASMCEHNSIKISYPLHDLIQRYDNRRKKRSLEYMKIDLTSNNKDSLREKLDKGKEIVEEYDDTDIFNINDKIYSDICIAVEVDGKDLTLQDRINYFYPEMSICENNCTYNHTDYINERIYCDCSFKKEFDFKREYYPTIEIDTEKVKNDQGGNMNIAVLKCIPNLKYKKSLSGNGGFIFMLIIIVIEFVLLMIIIIIGISSLLNKLKNKMKKEDNEEEDEDVDIEVVSVSNTNQEEKKEREKETQRKLNVPPKRKENYTMEFIPPEYVFLFFNQNEKGVIKKVERNSVPFKTQYNTRILLEKKKNVNYDNIKPRGPFPGDQNILVIVDSMDDSISDYIYDDESEDNGRKNSERNDLNDGDKGTNKKYEPLSSKINKKNKKHSHNYHQKNGDEKYNEKYDQNIKKYKKKIEFSITDYDPSDENYSEIEMDENQEKGFIESIKKEQRLLKKNYEIASQNKNSSNFVIMLFTEIIDKIYITNILLFTRKFDILSLQLSIYVLCHTLLLILLALFYDVKTIEKIWNNDNYPGLGYYLLYGFLACIIIWIIYKIILCLWSNNDKIKEILKLIHINKKYGINNEKMMEKKYNNLACKIKLKIIIYSIIEFLLLAFCFIYFVTFCTVYTGTKNKVFKSYGIALIEILIIKIVYGIVLAILRKVSLSKEKKTLYDVVVFMNTYLV